MKVRRQIIIAACVLCAILLSGVASADKASDWCEAKKLKVTGAYVSCRLEADAKALLKGTSPDYTRCDEELFRGFEKAERRGGKAGTVVCPTEGDQLLVRASVARYTVDIADALSPPVDDGCPSDWATRTGHEVMFDLWEAIVNGDEDRIACNFHDDAFLIDDQGILVGKLDIVTSFISLGSLFPGVRPDVTQGVHFLNTYRALYELDAGWVVIPDGSDSYIIEEGKIRSGTRHGLIEFTGPPPDPAP